MIQPYEPRVDAEGETGLIYLGGSFSHAAHKDPMIRRGVGPTDSLIENQVVTGATATAAQRERGGPRPGGGRGPPRPDHLRPRRHGRDGARRAGPARARAARPRLFLTLHPEGAVTLARLLAAPLGTA